MIEGGVSGGEESDGAGLGEELHQAGCSDEGDQRGELGVEHDQVQDGAEGRAGSQGGGRGQGRRVQERRVVVVGNQQVVVAHLVVQIVVGAVVDHIVMERIHRVDFVVDFMVEMVDRNGEMRDQTMVIRNWLQEAVIIELLDLCEGESFAFLNESLGGILCLELYIDGFLVMNYRNRRFMITM